MSVRTKQYLMLGVYVLAVWSGIQLGLNLCNFGKRVYSFHQVPTICEPRLSKHNAIKSHWHSRLNSKTFDTFMHVSLYGFEVDAMNWLTIFNIWKNVRDQRILTLH